MDGRDRYAQFRKKAARRFEKKYQGQHAYIFLTKCPDKISFSTDDENVWMGVTVTRNSEKKRLDDLKRNIKAMRLGRGG